jgi:hypothetical protein
MGVPAMPAIGIASWLPSLMSQVETFPLQRTGGPSVRPRAPPRHNSDQALRLLVTLMERCSVRVQSSTFIRTEGVVKWVSTNGTGGHLRIPGGSPQHGACTAAARAPTLPFVPVGLASFRGSATGSVSVQPYHLDEETVHLAVAVADQPIAQKIDVQAMG